MRHLDEAAIANFLHGPRASEAAAGVRRHLQECESCRVRVQQYAATPHRPPDGDPTVPPERHDPTWPGKELPRAIGKGEKLGRYLVLDSLGEGGMGVVYAAYDPELDRKVAVKLLSPAAFTDADAQARLLREAQAMARVSHPNVIAVHDVGTLGDRVFVAMELVEGGTLREWLGAQPRTWREIAAQFVQAGRGLAAAHERGLVHRDFKPENVLVGRDGRPRVTDFGLARLVSAPGGEPPSRTVAGDGQLRTSSSRLEAQLTEYGVVMGTPAYMSPEHQLGEDIDARSDQFSFCAALYWALYKKRAFDPDTLAAAASKNLARDGGATRSERASATRARAKELGRGVIQEPPRDAKVPSFVRRVVLRGLAIDPADRFGSMEALLAELGHDPQVARRRWGLAGAAALTLVAAGVAWQRSAAEQTQLCRGAERKLTGVWDADTRAALEAAFVATSKPYATDAAAKVRGVLDGYTTQWVAMHTDACEATRLRGEQTEQVLSLRMICLDRRLQEVRALSDLAGHADSQVVERAVDAAHALSSLSGCADVEALLARVSLPEDPAARARIAAADALVAEAKALHGAGRYQQGLAVASRARAEADAVAYAPLRAAALLWRGRLLERSGDPAAAAEELTEAVWAAEAGRDDETKARAAIQLLYVEGYSRARKDAAELWRRAARAALDRTGGEPELERDFADSGGAVALHQQRFDDAVTQFERAYALAERTLGKDDPRRGKILVNLATALGARGDAERAMQTTEEALVIIERTLGRDHPYAAYPHNTLSHVYEQRGDYERALFHLYAAMGIWKAALGPGHQNVGDANDHLATILQAQRRYPEALVAAQEALRIKRAALGADHPDLSYSLENLGNALVGLGRAREALPHFERAVRLRDAAKEPAPEIRFALARALVAISRSGAARARLLAVRARAEFDGAGDPGAAAEVARWMAEQKLR